MTMAPLAPLQAHLRLLDAEEALEHEEQFLQVSGMALAFAASLDLTEVLEAVTQHVARLFGGVCRVRFAPAQRPAAKRRVVAGPDPEARPRDGLGVDETYAALLSRLDDHEPPPADTLERRTPGGAALLFAPLIARGRRIGSLDVVISAPGDVDVVRHQRLLRTIAAHAALAIDTADRFAQAQPAALAGSGSLDSDPGPMLSLIAHDLRSPLTALSAGVQTLARLAKGSQPIDREQLRRLTQLAEAAVAQLGAQIDALTPDPDLNPAGATEGVDLVRLTRLLTHFYQQTTGRHKLITATEAAELPTPLTRTHAERIVSNLLVNGIKYSPVGGEIVVKLGCEHDLLGDWATLSVRNNGIGIPPQDLPSLCQAGYRARNVGAIPGTGFGLVSVRELVEQYGGTFAIQSVVGETTTVRIRVPLAPRAPQQAER